MTRRKLPIIKETSSRVVISQIAQVRCRPRAHPTMRPGVWGAQMAPREVGFLASSAQLAWGRGGSAMRLPLPRTHNQMHASGTAQKCWGGTRGCPEHPMAWPRKTRLDILISKVSRQGHSASSLPGQRQQGVFLSAFPMPITHGC